MAVRTLKLEETMKEPFKEFIEGKTAAREAMSQGIISSGLSSYFENLATLNYVFDEAKSYLDQGSLLKAVTSLRDAKDALDNIKSQYGESGKYHRELFLHAENVYNSRTEECYKMIKEKKI